MIVHWANGRSSGKLNAHSFESRLGARERDELALRKMHGGANFNYERPHSPNLSHLPQRYNQSSTRESSFSPRRGAKIFELRNEMHRKRLATGTK
jgi:hypothetical protein